MSLKISFQNSGLPMYKGTGIMIFEKSYSILFTVGLNSNFLASCSNMCVYWYWQIMFDHIRLVPETLYYNMYVMGPPKIII